MVTKALHDDAGKIPFEIIPPVVLEETAAVFQYGAEKYGIFNWRKGMPWQKLMGSILRHLMAWEDGEDTDLESNLPHLSHAIADAMMLLDYQINGLGEDNRPRIDAESIGWTAGFLDADGCIGIAKVQHKNPPSIEYTPRISASQIDPAPLLRLQSLWGGRVYARKLGYSNLSKKKAWQWVLGTAQARTLLMATLSQYTTKKSAARNALRLALRISHHGHGGALALDEQLARANLYEKSKYINKRHDLPNI